MAFRAVYGPSAPPSLSSLGLAIMCSHTALVISHSSYIHLSYWSFDSPEGVAKTLLQERQWSETIAAWDGLFQISSCVSLTLQAQGPLLSSMPLPLYLELRLQLEIMLWVSILIMTIIYGLLDIRRHGAVFFMLPTFNPLNSVKQVWLALPFSDEETVASSNRILV